jgi:hypothetical protein
MNKEFINDEFDEKNEPGEIEGDILNENRDEDGNILTRGYIQEINGERIAIRSKMIEETTIEKWNTETLDPETGIGGEMKTESEQKEKILFVKTGIDPDIESMDEIDCEKSFIVNEDGEFERYSDDEKAVDECESTETKSNIEAQRGW